MARLDRYLLRTVFISILACMSLTTATASPDSKPFVIPELKSWEPLEGNFHFEGKPVICIPAKDTSLFNIAKMFSEDWETMFGTRPQVRGRKGDIIFTIEEDAHLGKEGYRITISDNITVSAPLRQESSGPRAPCSRLPTAPEARACRKE